MSSQLEELQKLQAKVKVFNIPLNPKEGEVQAKIEFTALALDDMGLLSPDENATQEQMMESNFQALAKSLNLDISEIKKTLLGYFEDLIECMLDINNMGDEKTDKKPSRIERAMAKKKEMEDAKSNK